ncbi:ribosomal protein L1 [Dacryopinax primogenitus]|uniref:Ribosomal L1 domain-containing protein 1 n=1 Tax=Dacryopinax primogenitus (strain DJM 731) TaxID=1858805 RepID=M5G553_DACPD|nr:ribosomal protein L1 [Dacryopinax primogenitus]EJU03360.1 ribosomal protein L1 [Dacryopinax primogenitus]
MVAETLIDDHVSQDQALLAAKALAAYVHKQQEKEEDELLPQKQDVVWLVVATKRIPRTHKVKPIKIPLIHPVIDPRETSICLLTKDPQREYKDLIAEHKINFISRVVGVAKLKGKHKPFEARRQLLKEHGLFLADQRIVPLLPALLGKMFFDAKKQPVPVDLTAKDLKKELARAVSSTYMHQNAGTCVSIKLGTVSHTPEQIVANLTSALPAIVKHIEGEWENVLSLSLKTGRSTALPVWSCSVEERFSVPSLDAARQEVLEKKALEKEKKEKGKKRKAEETAAEEGGTKKPKKAAKKAEVVEDEEEDDEEFTGFGNDEDDDDDAAEAEEAETEPPAPPKPKKTDTKKPRKTVQEEADLEPLSLVSSGKPKSAKKPQASAHVAEVPKPEKSKKSKKSEPAMPAAAESKPEKIKKSKKPDQETESEPVLPAALSNPKPVEKVDKKSKKGGSVQRLQTKLQRAGKGSAAEGAKRKVLGKKRIDD